MHVGIGCRGGVSQWANPAPAAANVAAVSVLAYSFSSSFFQRVVAVLRARAEHWAAVVDRPCCRRRLDTHRCRESSCHNFELSR
jgi:hypothetical protein